MKQTGTAATVPSAPRSLTVVQFIGVAERYLVTSNRWMAGYCLALSWRITNECGFQRVAIPTGPSNPISDSPSSIYKLSKIVTCMLRLPMSNSPLSHFFSIAFDSGSLQKSSRTCISCSVKSMSLFGRKFSSLSDRAGVV